MMALVAAQLNRARGARSQRPATAALVVGLALWPAACGDTTKRAPTAPRLTAAEQRAIAGARARSRPIGVGPRFQPAPPPPSRRVSDCRRARGSRFGAHLELFAADRVVLVPTGIGVGRPWRTLAGRITSARCYGPVATLEPTGLIIVRAGTRAVLGDLFRAWGEPLGARRMGDFTAGAGKRVAAFVGGRRWRGAPEAIPLVRHAVIVLEVGPFVPPHRTYAFPNGL
jgi:hypothetical protein